MFIFRLLHQTLCLISLIILLQTTAIGRDLAQILIDGIGKDPAIIEAQANERIAISTLDKTKAQRYPVVRGKLTQPALRTDGKNKDFMPGITASWTVYDFGILDAQIDRDRLKSRFFKYKTDETAHELAYQLSNDFLEALRAKMALQVAQENLNRHSYIVNQLAIILEYDPGRRSEYTQAQARLIQVKESIVSYRRAMNLALKRLARYVKPQVQIEELRDPFKNDSVEDLIARYHIDLKQTQKHSSYLAQYEELQAILSELQAREKGRYPTINVQAEADKDDAAMYLVLGVDLFNRSKDPEIEEQIFQAEAARARLLQLSEDLVQRADVAALQMKEDNERIMIAKEQIRALEQVVVDYQDQFKIAARSLLDVVNAYAELAGVKQLEVQAQYDLMRGKLEYLTALGEFANWAKLPSLSSEFDAEGQLQKNEQFVGVRDKKIAIKQKLATPTAKANNGVVIQSDDVVIINPKNNAKKIAAPTAAKKRDVKFEEVSNNLQVNQQDTLKINHNLQHDPPRIKLKAAPTIKNDNNVDKVKINNDNNGATHGVSNFLMDDNSPNNFSNWLQRE